MPRLILILLGFTAFLLIAGLLLVPMLVDKQKILEFASTQLQEQTGATLTVKGETTLSVFPVLGVSLQQASIDLPGEDTSTISAGALSIGVQLLPLLSGSVEIASISAEGLTARVVSRSSEESAETSGMSDRELDAFYEARRQALAEAGARAGAEAALAAPLALKIQDLSITSARLESVDAKSGEISVLEIPRLRASGLNLDQQPIPVSLALIVPGDPDVAVELDARVRVSQEQQNLLIDELTAQVNGATAQTLELGATGDVDLSRQIANLNLNIEIGSAEGGGKVRYASFESPQIDASLKFNQFNPALVALAGPEAGTEAAQTAPATSADQPLPLDALRPIDTRAELSFDQVQYPPHTLENVNIQLRALEGTVTVSQFTGDLHGGKVNMTATFDGRHNTASLQSSGGIKSVDIATALAAMESEPVFTGSADLDWQINGSGRTANELIASLQGPIVLSTDQPVLKGLSVEGMLCQAVALINQEKLTSTFAEDTGFQALKADLALAGGKLQLAPIKAGLNGVQLTGKGELDLLSQDFDTTFKARLSPALEDLDHACRVSKRLTAVDWPIKCKGNTAEDPAKWCRVKTDNIVEELTTNEARRKLEKKAGKLLDKLLN